MLHLNPKSGRWLPDVSHLQRHVNAAIAYSIWRYWEWTRDDDFLAACGAEVVLEIARFFASLTSYNEELDRYEIRGVMGPDEYHTGYPWSDDPGLDNNAYTNVMAAWVMSRALDLLGLLPAPRRDELVAILGLTDEETAAWQRMSRRMLVVFHDGVISQFERYDELEEFDWDGYRKRYGNIQRLDRILESEDDSPNRYKVSKQADVLMLFYLFPMDELQALFSQIGYSIDRESMARTSRYYAVRTSHSSTLSGVVHAWCLRDIERARSWSFFTEALRADYHDTQGGTTREGIHMGTMAGTVDVLERGYMGLAVRDDVLCFDPELPAEITRLSYTLLFRGHWIDVDIESGKLTIGHRPSATSAVSVRLGDVTEMLEPGMKTVAALDGGRLQTRESESAGRE